MRIRWGAVCGPHESWEVLAVGILSHAILVSDSPVLRHPRARVTGTLPAPGGQCVPWHPLSDSGPLAEGDRVLWTSLSHAPPALSPTVLLICLPTRTVSPCHGPGTGRSRGQDVPPGRRWTSSRLQIKQGLVKAEGEGAGKGVAGVGRGVWRVQAPPESCEGGLERRGGNAGVGQGLWGRGAG